jgi:hypothetical protein
MEKAYDFKGLLSELKNNGLEIAEESAKVVIESVFVWLQKSATLSENKYDDLAVILYPQLKAYALEQAEKINKEG